MSDTSHKHCKFIQEPIGEKPVTALAGIGKVLASRLADNRINKVSTCVDCVLCHTNLSVCVTASNFVPYACDRSVTRGECEGPEVLYRRPLFPVVAWQQNGRTVL